MTFWHEWIGAIDGRETTLVRTLVNLRGWRVDLHKIIGSDDPECFHTHPATAIRVILWGGYFEEIEGGYRRRLKPGRISFVRPWLSHRIAELPNGASWSLWLRSPKTAAVQLRGPGWDAQRASIA